MQKENIITWFENKDWLQNWNIFPHPVTDAIKFSSVYHSKPELWNRAFRFLKDADLNTISVGIHKIDENELFANVQEYNTMDDAQTSYEAHRRYADIQYMITGSERIGIVPLDKTSEVVPYDEGRDIVFLTAGADVFHLATQTHFFIFLPDDAHRPCLRYQKCEPVRKIVLKVKL